MEHILSIIQPKFRVRSTTINEETQQFFTTNGSPITGDVVFNAERSGHGSNQSAAQAALDTASPAADRIPGLLVCEITGYVWTVLLRGHDQCPYGGAYGDDTDMAGRGRRGGGGGGRGPARVARCREAAADATGCG